MGNAAVSTDVCFCVDTVSSPLGINIGVNSWVLLHLTPTSEFSGEVPFPFVDEETKAPRGHGLSRLGRGPSGILGHVDPSHRSFHCSRVRNTAGGQEDPLPKGTKNSDNSVRKRQKPTGKLAKVLNRLFMRGSPSGEMQTSPRMGTRTHHRSERLGFNTANTSAGGRRESLKHTLLVQLPWKPPIPHPPTAQPVPSTCTFTAA